MDVILSVLQVFDSSAVATQSLVLRVQGSGEKKVPQVKGFSGSRFNGWRKKTGSRLNL
jgi:hypothetical protein